MRKTRGRNPMTACRGLTIIQLMAALFVLGIVLWAAVNLFVDSRCESQPSASLCAGRSGAWMSLRGK
jgi:Tfp pilus assembly protein PilW